VEQSWRIAHGAKNLRDVPRDPELSCPPSRAGTVHSAGDHGQRLRLWLQPSLLRASVGGAIRMTLSKSPHSSLGAIVRVKRCPDRDMLLSAQRFLLVSLGGDCGRLGSVAANSICDHHPTALSRPQKLAVTMKAITPRAASLPMRCK